MTISPITARPTQFAFTFRDDGRGLDLERIRSRATEQGTFASRDLCADDESKIISLIFEPGFSTSDEAKTDLNLGMGMNIVRQRVSECNGKISVVSGPGRFCEFKITIPLAVLAHA